jgi:hypothetical protein
MLSSVVGTNVTVEIRVLQRKVDEMFTELANYESEKANLEVAKQAGIVCRGANGK